VPTTTTPRSRLRRRAGLVAIAPLLLAGLAACGDDDDGGGGDSAGGSTEAFCDGIENVINDAEGLEDELADASPEELIDQFGNLVGQLEDIDPPGEIADDWNASIEVLTTMAEGDVEDLATFEPTEEQNEAGNRVGAFIEDECGVEDGGLFGA
jgi:hypothetical protein